MPDTKTPEEIILNVFHERNLTLFRTNKEVAVIAMKAYATQQSRAIAIGFAKWVEAEGYSEYVDGWAKPGRHFDKYYSDTDFFDLYLLLLTNQNE